MEGYVSGTGSIELDNDCQYSIDLRSTRSRESVVPKDDLAFYFNTYIEPKYGLGNINVSNVASFMKDLEMNWTKLTPDLKDKVLNIMVDNIKNHLASQYAKPITDYAYITPNIMFLPIPYSDMLNNPNLVQNPGY